MEFKVQVNIEATKAKIWGIITDIDNSPQHISGIEKVEVLNQPAQGLVGLKWIETRTLFGKTATETMWITEEEPEQYYKTRAESHGSIYTTLMKITEQEGHNTLAMHFGGQAQTISAKIMSALLGSIMRRATEKALLKDLMDIKKIAEASEQMG